MSYFIIFWMGEHFILKVTNDFSQDWVASGNRKKKKPKKVLMLAIVALK